MSCARHEPELREHAHGATLSPALEAHLASCAVCQDVLAAEQRLRAEIDGALGAVGRVEPSPIFLARARAIAVEQPPQPQDSWRHPAQGRWPIWALSALAGAVLLAVLVARTRPPSVERAPAVASAPGVPSAPGLPAAPGVSAGPPPSAAKHSPTPAARLLPHPAFSEPSVIVPTGQADALVRLASLIDAGSVAPPKMLLEPPDPDQELSPPADLHFRPLAIEPLVDEGSDTEGDTL